MSTTLLNRALARQFPELYSRWLHRSLAPLPYPGVSLVLSFDVELRRDACCLPELLRLLASYRLPASFACIGRWIEEYPAEHRALVEAGHEILNHSYSHPNSSELDAERRFDRLTFAEAREEVLRCHQVCQNIVGVAPSGFRTPHFGVLHNSTVNAVLEDLGYRFSSSTNAAATPSRGGPYRVGRLWEFPLTGCPRHPLLPLDTWHALRAPDAAHRRPGQLAALVDLALRHGDRGGGFVNLYFDPLDALEGGLEGALRAVARRGDRVRVTSYAALVRELGALCPAR